MGANLNYFSRQTELFRAFILADFDQSGLSYRMLFLLTLEIGLNFIKFLFFFFLDI